MSRAPSFDPLVDDYDAARPSYPSALYDEIEALAGRPLSAAQVVEIGAGTGIATRGLVERGARVLVIDVGSRMLDRLRQRLPDVPAVLASGEALPARDTSADLVCAAQAWHWLDPARGAAEAARVLRPGGSLAVWWNDVAAAGEPWYDAQQDRLEAMSPGYTRGYRARDYAAELAGSGRFAAVETATVRWQREIDLSTYARWLRSKSYVAAIGERLEDFLAGELDSLRAAFPSGLVREPFRTVLHVARLR